MAGYQVLGIRGFWKTDEKTGQKHWKKFDEFYEKRWRFDDIREAFTNPKGLLDRLGVPDEERFNLYYTIAFCKDAKRDFDWQEIMPFDIDGIDTERRAEYVAPVLEALQVDAAKTVVVFSGNGLHFVVLRNERFTEAKYFDDYRVQYKAICKKVDAVLEALRLPGKLDVGIFDAARILRIPETLNVKPDKNNPDKLRKVKAEVMQGTLEPQAFDMEAISGLKKWDANNAIAKDELKRYRRSDGNAAFEECLFLKHCKAEPASIDEPELYAALSIIGRFKGGEEQAVEVFKPRFGVRQNGGTESDLRAKLSQSVEASGPRTCVNINATWGGCKACPHFEKVKSPIVIYGRDVIPTEASGFHDIIPGAEGKPPKVIPNYNDLLRAFIRDTNYFRDALSDKTFGWVGTHYRAYQGGELLAFSEEMFFPKPLQKVRTEFRAKVEANRLKPTEELEKFFYETTSGKLNLKNGVLDIATGNLYPHSQEYGFTYVLPYEYDEKAACPEFEKFLDEVTIGRDSLKKTLLEFMGYCLWPAYDDHCFLWLSGSGRNGKSTYMELIQELVGKDNAANVMLEQFVKSNYLEMLHHKLVNLSEESDQRKIPAQVLGTLKALSAGGTVMVDQKYERPYSMRNISKLIFASNSAPVLEGTQQAILSRMIVVPFDLRLEDSRTGESKTRHELPAQLRAELPGILNLALRSLREVLARKPVKIWRGDESKAALNEIVLDSDALERFVQERLVTKPEAVTELKRLWEAYQGTFEIESKKYAGSDRTFSKRLREKFGSRIQFKLSGRNKTTHVFGLELTAQSSSLFTLPPEPIPF